MGFFNAQYESLVGWAPPPTILSCNDNMINSIDAQYLKYLDYR